MDRIEDVLASVERTVHSTIQSLDIPDLREAANKLWDDISRYGPDVHIQVPRIPGLGDFEIPPPPFIRSPPPPPSWYERVPVKPLAVGVVGAGLLVGYTLHLKRKQARRSLLAHAGRRKVVVVLGADLPHGQALIDGLQQQEYIVIASVSTPEAVDALEQRSNGYVKALVLDPSEPGMVPVFLRSLSSCMGRRFPLNSAGDPFASPASMPYIHSIVSLLPLAVPPTSSLAPLENVDLQSSFLSFLSSSHLVPLQVIQALLPMLRNGGARQLSTARPIVICVPSTPARVGLPFTSVQTMATAATVQAADVLRREITVASLTDKADALKNVRIVVLDVGAFDLDHQLRPTQPEDVYRAMSTWTQSEKLIYGPSFAAFAYQTPSPRKPSQASVFVKEIVTIVGDRIPWWKRKWFGDRWGVGAGAATYRWASYLPPRFLDALLSLPHVLVSIRNALAVRQPTISRPPVATSTGPGPAPIPEVDSQPSSDHDSGNEAGSEASIDSVPTRPDVADSWVSLNEKEDD
ncbi:hypothetical protein DL96DRAFT_1498247 [Flagelloscypha sp. PMI_526]|nr:hypothetical protein DL96DRAFT_1498247 [Flagelloscypha sp. PMI_526]